MVTRRRAFALATVGVILAMIAGLALTQLPVIGAGGLLHPARTRVVHAASDTCRDATFAGAGVTLKGSRCSASGVLRGTIVYLHGTADNRTSSAGVIRALVLELQRCTNIDRRDRSHRADFTGV